MNSILKTFGTSLFIFILIFAQGCNNEEMPNPINVQPDGTRYQDIIFADVQSTMDVVYGENTDQNGSNISLRMNIFEPANDAEAGRPLIILAHGGGFAEGDREDFNELAALFAQSGYVAATISYRLIAGDGELKFAVVDAVQDMKAAVRYFTIDNKFSIDPDNIFVGGFSAGAVMACHYAYFNDADIPSAPQELQDYLAATGGLSGNSGNAGARESIKGVISISGGIFDADWISANEPVLYSIHGDNDTDVTCTKDPEALTNPDGDFTEGPCLIHPILDSLGITNLFRKIDGGDHGAYFTCEDCDEEMRQFIFENL
ncbi:MAG: alpha/beta hydrolase [Bacteroidota bacterium]